MDRTKISFAEAEGKSDFPSILKWGEIDKRIRARVWKIVVEDYVDSAEQDYNFKMLPSSFWKDAYFKYMTDVKFIYIDEVIKLTSKYDYLMNAIEGITKNGLYVDFFDFYQFIIRFFARNRPEFVKKFTECLDTSFSPYRVTGFPPTIVPFLSDEQSERLGTDLAAAFSSPFLSARDHLARAIDGLNQGNHAEVIREAITAVESSAREFSGQSTLDLSGALKKIGKTPGAHNGLYQAFSILYGYTSNEKGIRHSMLFGEKPNVDVEEAIFFVSACAAFVGYLSRKKEKLAAV